MIIARALGTLPSCVNGTKLYKLETSRCTYIESSQVSIDIVLSGFKTT